MVKRKTFPVWGLWAGRLALSGATLRWMGFIFYLSSLSQVEVSQPLESPVPLSERPRTSRVSQLQLQNWRREWDSNPRYSCPYSGFQDRRLRPLGHPSYSYSISELIHCRLGMRRLKLLVYSGLLNHHRLMIWSNFSSSIQVSSCTQRGRWSDIW